VLSDPGEIGGRREQSKLVANAKLGQDGVDRADLDPSALSAVAKPGCLEVVVSIGDQEGEGAEPSHDRLVSRRRWNP
jgi:hypothetical protein